MDRKGIFQMKLNCQSVTKTFQNQTAVDKVSFTLSEPMICGLLGRNGAGKTTLLRMIANRFQPAAGQILLDEHSVWENEQAQRQIFFATEGANFAEMKVRDIIRWMAAAYPNFDKEQCLNYAKQFELDLKKNNLKLSTGYKSVLRVVLALSVHTPLLLLDEVDKLLEEAEALIVKAHNAQTEVIQSQVSGESMEYSLLFVHAQDTVMTITTELRMTQKLLPIVKMLLNKKGD